MGNHLYYGDNLSVLRESIADESVDLIKVSSASASLRACNRRRIAEPTIPQ